MLYHCLRSLLETRSTFCWLAGEGTHWMSLKYVHFKRNEIYFDDIILCNYPSFSFEHEQETAFFRFLHAGCGSWTVVMSQNVTKAFEWVTKIKNSSETRKAIKKFGLFWQQQVFVSENPHYWPDVTLQRLLLVTVVFSAVFCIILWGLKFSFSNNRPASRNVCASPNALKSNR